MAKKFLSMLLALSMMLTVLAACNNDAVDPVENPDDQQEELQDDGQENGETVSDVLNLVVDGVSDYVIVRGENAYVSEVTASTELQSYLKQISGVEIPIVTDAVEAVEKEIVVGKTNREADGEFDREELGDDGFIIKTVGEKLYLVGGEQRGTLYSVYEFLESYLGCRFYTADVELVPELKTVSIEPISEDKQIPVMEYRAAHWDEAFDQSYSVKRRLNAMTGESWHSEELGGSFIMNPFVHTFPSIVNYSVYGAEHPEYFAHKEDGTLIDNDGNPQLCLTNPEVLDIAIAWVKNIIESTPNIKVVSVSQYDGGGPCMCTECQKVYAEENGAYSGTNIRFVNAVANAIKDEYPDVRIETLAYQYSREACVTKPVDNVIVRLCTIECCFVHPLSECDVQTFKPSDSTVSSNSLAQDIEDWSEICDNLYIWDYTTNFKMFALNFSSFRSIKENIKFFAEHNVTGIFEQGPGGHPSQEFGALRVYLISKLLWDPYMSDEEYYALIDEFLAYVYGPGWTYIKEFIDFKAEFDNNFHAGCKENDGNFKKIYENVKIDNRGTDVVPEGLTVDMILNYETTDWSPYYTYYVEIIPNDVLVKGLECFEKALELAETDSQKRYIEQSMIQVEILESYYLKLQYSRYIFNVATAVQNYLNSVEHDLDVNEIKKEIRAFILEKTNQEYYEYNKALAEKMIGFGMCSVQEVWNWQTDPFTREDVDYLNEPRNW